MARDTLQSGDFPCLRVLEKKGRAEHGHNGARQWPRQVTSRSNDEQMARGRCLARLSVALQSDFKVPI